MRTDVKLGVIFALVLVLGAGGYFMFRGEKQDPISLTGATPASTEGTQAGKPAGTKTAANQPKTPPTTTTKRPAINPNPRPASNDPNAAARPPRVATPSNPATTNPGATMPRPTTPAGPSTSPASPAATAPEKVVTTTPQPAAASPSPSAPLASSAAQPDASPATVRPEASPANKEIALTGIPASPSTTTPPGSSPAQPSTTMTPLTNTPSTTTQPASAPPVLAMKPAIPPGIKPAASDKVADTVRKADAPEAAQETHKVQVGDSLAFLAQTYYGDQKYAKIIADANPGLSNPNNLKVGTKINIPALPKDADARVATGTEPAKSTDKADAKENGRVYTVKAGDSFYSIAKSQLGNASRWKELLALNHAVVNGDPTSLRPGQRLVLPDSR